MMEENKDLKNRIAIITGASGGIGSAAAVDFAKNGASGIIIADIDKEKALNVISNIENSFSCKCIFVHTNIGNVQDIENLFETAVAEFKTLDILVNCAGVTNTFSIDEVNPQQWDKLMSINLRGTYLCCREAFKIMRANNYGKIINISSISGRIGGYVTGIDYVTSKGGIIAMTMSLAKIAGPFNINVNAVAPGFIDTEMTKDFTHFNPETVPLRRIGKPQDVASVITFLASEKSSYITGATIDINGGTFMS
ncbi:MAG: SDR family oxidoreductase [Actinobacteria bacterium]|nr:SDR family oxidoreductase [Actinomycetota bacterium]